MSADFLLVMHSVQRAYNHNCMLQTDRVLLYCVRSVVAVLRGVWALGGGCVFTVHAPILYCLGIILV